jgi:hypothetical protein
MECRLQYPAAMTPVNETQMATAEIERRYAEGRARRAVSAAAAPLRQCTGSPALLGPESPFFRNVLNPTILEADMKRTLILAAAALVIAAVVLTGCGRKPNDEQAIGTLLATSGYTNEEQTKNYGANDTTPQPGGDGTLGTDGYERIPFVRFRRYIPANGLNRTLNIQIPAYPGGPDTTALVTVTWDITGELRTMFDTTTNPILTWRKPFHDVAVRKVYLEKHPDAWHIIKVSPLVASTQNAPYNLHITSLHAEGRVSGEVFDLNTSDTMLTKDQLPCFVPNDTVLVTVTVESDDDSCWTFLHHGRPQRPHIWRHPYWRTGTWTFERVWVIGDESQYDVPSVRPSIHDAIGWSALWADSSKPYVAAAWGIPYIVKNPNESLPSDQ